MPEPYSMDLRARAMARFQSGENSRSVAKLLSIGIATAIRWQQRHRSTDSVTPLPVEGSKPSNIVGDDADCVHKRAFQATVRCVTSPLN